MAVYSTNQVRHLYVAKVLQTTNAITNPGDIKIKTVGNVEKSIYFEAMGAKGALKSDYIPVKNITAIKKITAAQMAYKLKSVKVTIDSSLLTSSKLTTTEDYLLRISFDQFYGASVYDKYVKDVAVHGVAGTTATAFYASIVDALNLAFSREVGASKTSNPYLTFSSDSTGVVISEKEQSWQLGVEASERVMFEVTPTTITTANGEVTWGSVADNTATYNQSVGNGKRIADLEYFCLGARGDRYRYVGAPYGIITEGLVSASSTYDVIEIHYAFTDTGVNSYRTEKDITIAIPAGTITASVVTALETATGINFDTSNDSSAG